jgi:hypothetical protein
MNWNKIRKPSINQKVDSEKDAPEKDDSTIRNVMPSEGIITAIIM